MKRTLAITLMLVLAVGIPGIAKSDCQEEVIWQIGIRDGDVEPSVGAAEYPVIDPPEPSYTEYKEYLVDSNNPVDVQPDFPGFLGDKSVCAINPDAPACTFTTPEVLIRFSLDRTYDAEELTLFYGRYGIEEEELAIPAFQEDLHVIVGGSDEGFQEFVIPLPKLLAGDQLVDIRYDIKNWPNNGHYIDYLKLVAISGNCEETVAVDVKPQSCPNPLNTKSKGVLPVAILGTENLQVDLIDLSTVLLEGSVAPLRLGFDDVATPSTSASEKEDCFYDCNELGPDGFLDLTLKFDTQEVVAALGQIVDGECLTVHLTGNLLDGTPIEGEDVVLILDKPNSQGEQEKKGKK